MAAPSTPYLPVDHSVSLPHNTPQLGYPMDAYGAQHSGRQDTYNNSGDDLAEVDPLVLAEDPNNIVFSADIIDGYSFRNTIEYLKTTNKKANFIFTKDNIFYAQDNANHTVLNVMILYGSELSSYMYRSPKETEVVGMDISSLRTITKPIGKKDSVRLFRLVGSQLFFIQIISQNNRSSNRTNLNVVRPTVLPLQNYKMPQFTRDENNPNCKVPAAELAKTCNAINSIKCTHAWIRGFPQGLRIRGIIGNNIVGRSDSFGNTTETVPNQGEPDPSSAQGVKVDLSSLGDNVMVRPQQGLVMPGKRLVIRSAVPIRGDTKVAVGTIKALAKLNNLCTNGIVKFHINERSEGPDDAIKLTTNISNYGRLMIYLRDVDTVSAANAGTDVTTPQG